MKITIKKEDIRKETKEERYERVKNDTNHSCIFKNKKKYSRKKKHKGEDTYA